MELLNKTKKRKFYQKKRFIIPLIAIVVISIFSIFLQIEKNRKNVITDFAKYSDIKETIPVTGQLVSNLDLDLSFNNSGIVKTIKVKVGDKVKAGDILATLDQGEALASLTQAKGSLAGAKAKYKKVLEGETLTKIYYENAKRDYEKVKEQQETLVKNAYNNVLNSTPEAVPEDGSSDYEAPVISGNYKLGKEGIIKIKFYYSIGGVAFNLSGLVEGSGSANSIISQPLGDSGLYLNYLSSNIDEEEWTVEIPNKKAPDYLTNLNAYELALKTQAQALAQAQAVLDQRTAELAFDQSVSNSSALDLAKADILSAEGQVQLAQSRYENTILRAPAEGTITKIDIKIGELAQALKEVMVLQDVSNMYLEANINEANISRVKINAPVEITFDALGQDKKYKGNIYKIDPASTIISGVVNYKINATIDQFEELKPGMTANMIILVNEKFNTIAVPSQVILKDENQNSVIRVITNSKRKKFENSIVQTGIEADGGIVEIINGLYSGDEYVVLIKDKK